MWLYDVAVASLLVMYFEECYKWCLNFLAFKVPLNPPPPPIFSFKKSASFSDFIREKLISIDNILAFLQAFEHVISMLTTGKVGSGSGY